MTSRPNLTYGVGISYLIDTDTLVRLTKEKSCINYSTQPICNLYVLEMLFTSANAHGQ